ncbi:MULTISPECIES: ribose-5-phosphate isomerase RpiA [unclassified Methylophaga]|jgi:ribose 5-phosphate isomerase A|uniref:ribose-5-phosphate isomerase RpiA n=1 Tax=unclassified Methylophaga TaxID=2629249 RepID=UPI000C944F28|nr:MULTISPECIES: ribose-5-phosphate isomerase RpiA [unclassified Methylophaga]MAK65991.1 ribose 5-phosphate isomerase A [Methylophaga sp.]MAY18632.1 ribose 5-phosphate isomerase A [Methylophaga sp.]HAO25654.1 ribose 5-phosphate isomerase A [Methylophaga sp.]HCD05699.1 ribose 5-phosphate isomerase A [Methylophaga sp.]|tara:strand:- start:15897 stop:16598 length:702 start_codon:yes stop_codon:yes gene_type:complete
MTNTTEANPPNPKQQVAIKAAEIVDNGMIVGLGTGSTANLFIDELARRQQEQQLDIQVVASSVISRVKAQQAGLNVLSIEYLTHLDMYVDGADEVTIDMVLLKGRGQDLVCEKLLASHATAFYVLVDDSKMVKQIGDKNPIPIEVMPNAASLVLNRLAKLQAKGSLRLNAAGDNVAYSAAGNLILDMQFSGLETAQINALLTVMPGVVEHGIFADIAKAVLVGSADGVKLLQA